MPLPLSVDRTSFVEVPNLTAGALNALLVPPTDVSDFRWFSLTIIGASHVGQLSWQGSNDNFVNDIQGMYVYQLGLPSAYYQNATNVGSAAQIFHGPFFARYFRVIMNSYSSGSVTGILELYTQPSYPGTINAIQTGLWALGTAPSSNANGSAVFQLISTSTDNASVIKNSKGQVYGYDIFNTHATLVRYVKLYNKSSAPAPVSDASLLKRTIAVKPGDRAYHHSSVGLAGYDNGIGLAAVANSATNDDTAIGAGDLIINIDYSSN